MKRYIPLLIIAIFIIAAGFACTDDAGEQKKNEVKERIEGGDIVYPYYKSLNRKEKEEYVNICYGIENFSEKVRIGEFDSESDAIKAAKDFSNKYRQILYEQAEFFWVDPYEFEQEIFQSDDKYILFIKYSYILSEEEALEKKEVLDKKVREVVRGADSKSDTFDKVLYVYDYIMANVSYDHDLAESDDTDTLGRNAYGCLVDGKTVCSGYTQAFDIIMKKLGFECGVEFNSYESFSVIEGHVWNYCKLDDEYYYFDLTWDDTVFDSAEYKPYLDYAHNFFGITREELRKTHLIASAYVPTPYCGGTKYNYFIHKGYNLPEYSFEAAKQAILKQSAQNYIELRFDSYGELLGAESDLLKDYKIGTILPGWESVKYFIDESSLHLYIFKADN